MKNWFLVLSLFTRREKAYVYFLLASSCAIAVIQVAGIASIMPFIAVAVDPSIIDQNKYLGLAYEWMGFTSPMRFLVFLGCLSFVILLVSNGLMALDVWCTNRFCNLQEHKLSLRLMRSYLAKPYEFYLARNTAELSKLVIYEIERVVIGTLEIGIAFFSSIAAVVVILVLLIFVDPLVTFATLIILGSVYGSIYYLIKNKITSLGDEFPILSTEILKRVREAFQGIKDVKLSGNESEFAERYGRPSYRASVNTITYNTLDIIPDHGLETLAFGTIISVTIYFLSSTQDSAAALPMVALYAFATYRLIPYLKSLFDCLESLRFNSAAFDEVWRDFASEMNERPMSAAANDLRFQSSLALSSVSYRYPGTRQDAVTEVELIIRAGESVCFIGSTGAGKSTTVDLILGLLEPCSGHVLVDGVAITRENVRSWQRSIGYVPQTIFLSDGSISSNIAFGLPEQSIDQEKVAQAAKLAQIQEFIEGELPDDYSTQVGENGIRFSGGQRQRLGIARALYGDPKVLIFDESTNALDRVTEDALVDALFGIQGDKTIIFVSHKREIAARCDRIVAFQGGRMIANGNYAELLSNDAVRELLAAPPEGHTASSSPRFADGTTDATRAASE